MLVKVGDEASWEVHDAERSGGERLYNGMAETYGGPLIHCKRVRDYLWRKHLKSLNKDTRPLEVVPQVFAGISLATIITRGDLCYPKYQRSLALSSDVHDVDTDIFSTDILHGTGFDALQVLNVATLCTLRASRLVHHLIPYTQALLNVCGLIYFILRSCFPESYNFKSQL